MKLHIVGKGDPKVRASWVAESLEFLGTHKGLRSVDTLLLGFSGVDYKGKKTVASEMFGCGAEGLESGSGSEIVDEETERGVREVWDLVSKSGLGVFNLGTLYLPLGLLKKLSEEDVAPKINAMDTPDCQSLPKEYSAFARERGIELWAGGGGEGAGESRIPYQTYHGRKNDDCSPSSAQQIHFLYQIFTTCYMNSRNLYLRPISWIDSRTSILSLDLSLSDPMDSSTTIELNAASAFVGSSV